MGESHVYVCVMYSLMAAQCIIELVDSICRDCADA